MRTTLFVITLIFSFQLYAQFAIGTVDQTYNDPSRSRDIDVEIYYPSTSAGTGTPVASGSFPLITFGHGFVMGVDAYYNLKDSLVPLGYVFVLVNSETSFSPSHDNFSKDLLFVNNTIKSRAATDNTYILYQDLNGKSCIMGHSMGGGSTMLAGGLANTGDVTCLVGMAAAETTPSAVTACGNIDVPTMIFCASNDGVTPIAAHQQPMYNALNTCKFLINIIGGAHCYYANPNLACDFGEATSSTGISITRAEQQTTTLRYLKPFLKYFLYDDAGALANLNTQLTNTSESTNTFACNLNTIENGEHHFSIMQENGMLTISNIQNQIIKKLEIIDMKGKIIETYTSNEHFISISLESFPSGIYIAKLNDRVSLKFAYTK